MAFTEVAGGTATWVEPTPNESIDISDASFEGNDPLDGTGYWAQSRVGTYPDAAWELAYQPGACQGGLYVVRPKLMAHAGGTYRGTTWLYATAGNAVTCAANNRYRFRVYMRAGTGSGLPNVTFSFRLHPTFAAGVLEQTDHEMVGTGAGSSIGWTAFDLIYDADEDISVRPYIYCTADDSNTREKPFWCDCLSVTNLTTNPDWSEVTGGSANWSEV